MKLKNVSNRWRHHAMTRLGSLPQLCHFPHIETEDINKRRRPQARQHASIHSHTHTHTFHHSSNPLHMQTVNTDANKHTPVVMSTNISSNSPDFLGVGSWARIVGCQSALINTHCRQWWGRSTQTGSVLLGKRLNQLVNKRVHPLPPLTTWTILYHLDQHLSLPSSLWDLVEEIHLCRLVACLVSANRSK